MRGPELAVALVLAAIGGCAYSILRDDVEPPKTVFEVVQTCKPPALRRSREYILIETGTGRRYYQDHRGRRTPIAEESDLSKICKRIDD